MCLLLISLRLWELSFETHSGKAHFACPILLPILRIFRYPHWASKTVRQKAVLNQALLFLCMLFCNTAVIVKCSIALHCNSITDYLLLLGFFWPSWINLALGGTGLLLFCAPTPKLSCSDSANTKLTSHHPVLEQGEDLVANPRAFLDHCTSSFLSVLLEFVINPIHLLSTGWWIDPSTAYCLNSSSHLVRGEISQYTHTHRVLSEILISLTQLHSKR